jgi:serine/threonine protein kinase
MSKTKNAVSIASSTKTSKLAIGSTRWKAPETFGKSPKFSEKSDIFSLGMTIYEILTRKIPFEEEDESDPFNIAFIIKSGDRPEIPTSLQSNPLVSIINETWKQNPNERPTANEILNKLDLLVEKMSPSSKFFI